MDSLNRRLGEIAEARAFAFPPPAIAGVGTASGFSFMFRTAPAAPSTTWPATSTASWMPRASGRS
jgi:hypothetical protein